MKSSEQKEPADQKKRQIFVTGVAENFSVIAPAGVGKTQAIVERIVHISRHPRASARVSQSKSSKLSIAHFLARSTAFA